MGAGTAYVFPANKLWLVRRRPGSTAPAGPSWKCEAPRSRPTCRRRAIAPPTATRKPSGRKGPGRASEGLLQVYRRAYSASNVSNLVNHLVSRHIVQYYKQPSHDVLRRASSNDDDTAMRFAACEVFQRAGFEISAVVCDKSQLIIGGVG